MASRVVGVDFGHGAIRGVEVDNPNTARARVLRTAEVTLPDGAIVDGEVREVHTVATALKRLWATGGFKSKRAVLGVGNQRVLARDLTVPAMTLEQIRESLQFQVQDLLPVPVANAILDFYPVSEGTSDSGPVIHGLLIAALKDVVMTNESSTRVAGVETVAVDLIPFALTRLLANRASRDTVAFVDVGATTMTVAIATAGSPEFVRLIPAGGDDITRALIERADLSREQAEQAKRALGIPFAGGVQPQYQLAADTIISESGQLLTSLRNTINYFTGSRPRQVSKVVLTGGGAQLKGFSRALGEMTGLPVEIADPAQDSRMTVALALAMGSDS